MCETGCQYHNVFDCEIFLAHNKLSVRLRYQLEIQTYSPIFLLIPIAPINPERILVQITHWYLAVLLL